MNFDELSQSLSPAALRSDLAKPRGASAALARRTGAALQSAQHQDRRMQRGLQLLRPERALLHRRRTRRSSSGRRHPDRRPARAGAGRHALLHGRGVARRARRHAEIRAGARDRARSQPARHGSLRHARPDRSGRSAQAQGEPASPPTITTSTPRRSFIRRSSPPTPSPIGSTPSPPCRKAACRFAAAASSAWANRSTTGCACSKC